MRKGCLLLSLLLGTSVLLAQEVFTGRVKDEKTGLPLPGVSLTIRGNTTGTASDTNGLFQLKARKGDILMASILGYQAREIALREARDIVILLTPAPKELDQLLVIGYGTQRKADNTGSIVSITNKLIENRPVSSACRQWKGRYPAYRSARGQGRPEKRPRFWFVE
jgi:iron complex outermembrane receptor protein